MESVGAFAAKTHLSELLDQVKAGHKITITKRGKPVAMLVPVTSAGEREEIAEAITRIKHFRVRCKTGKIDIKALIQEGRR
ncbi:MAG: type II toxin-antitoxin system Phd/YefM family antitoxin [Burkholderiales bacterium]